MTEVIEVNRNPDSSFDQVSVENSLTDPSNKTITGEIAEVADTEIDLIEVQSRFDLPDAENLNDPTIAYVNDVDDYAGVFQE